MVKYVVSITQGSKQPPFFISDNKKKWAKTLEEAKHFNRLSDASAAKNRLDFRFSNVNANPPPAGFITVNIVKIDLTAVIL